MLGHYSDGVVIACLPFLKSLIDSVAISPQIRQQVIGNAQYRCEYCKTSSQLTGMPLTMEHIQPQSLGGSDQLSNLAAACYRCNEFKGAKTAAIDPLTNESVRFFNPRLDRWSEHFVWGNGGTHIVGISPIGSTTVMALRLNNDEIVAARSLWIDVGWHPPGS
jgi:HNH endonuclease